MKIIGISGKQGSGKSYMADVLVREFDAIHMGFADHLKIHGVLQGRWTYEEAFLTKPSRVRDALQEVGAGWRQQMSADCHIRALDARIQMMVSRSDVDLRFVISDLRYQNEIQYLLEKVLYFNASVIRLSRDMQQAGLTESQREHESETGLDSLDANQHARVHYVDNSVAKQKEAEDRVVVVAGRFFRQQPKYWRVTDGSE